MRPKSFFLIAVGSALIVVAALGALFPFVPILFSDAGQLSDYVENINDTEPSATPRPKKISTASSLQETATSVIPSLATPSPRLKPANDNRLFIEKINVAVPIVEGKDAGALLYGAWRYPGTSRPGKSSNTVIFGHRFRYLPPNNTTFYKLNKLVVGDMFSARWQGQIYRYTVIETKIIQPNDFSVVEPTEKSVITLITCTPIFTTKERLVVVGELVP